MSTPTERRQRRRKTKRQSGRQRRQRVASQKRQLTDQQERCLRAIRWFVRQHGKTPTQKELSKMLRKDSVQGCRSIIVALEKKGYIYRIPNVWRGIRVVDTPEEEALFGRGK
jgi:SOS-response transcriptional repressor LexA